MWCRSEIDNGEIKPVCVEQISLKHVLAKSSSLYAAYYLVEGGGTREVVVMRCPGLISIGNNNFTSD